MTNEAKRWCVFCGEGFPLYGNEHEPAECAENLKTRAEAAEAKMPCGHPRGCVVSASHAPDVMTTCHCGWCASIARAGAAEKQLAEAQGRIADLEREVNGLRYLRGENRKYGEAQDES